MQMDSRPLWQLDCRTMSFVLAIALSEDDLDRLAADVPAQSLPPRGQTVRRRNELFATCREEGPLARRIGDLLDVRWFERVVELRQLDSDTVRERVAECVAEVALDDAEQARRAQLGSLLWAVATDPRHEVHALAGQLVFACFFAGCGALRTAEERARP